MTDFLERIADCIRGGSTFDRDERLEMAREILAVIRPSGEAIEAGSFQMLMENYIRVRTDERLKIAIMALTLVATMSDKPTRKVAMDALAQIGVEPSSPAVSAK